ncbi:MAG TPA: hypothetical protein VI233_01830, partial [Puia sp.]
MKLLLSITLAAVYGITLHTLFISFSDVIAVMSLTFFFIVPFLIGFLTIFLLPYREHHTVGGAFFKTTLTVGLILLVTCLIKTEGMICWVMASPLFVIAAGLGGFVAFDRKKKRFRKKMDWDFEKDKWDRPDTLSVSLLFFIPLFVGLLEGKRTTHSANLSIEKQVDISASPEAVWSALTAPRHTLASSRRLSICNVLGFPHHVSTTLDTA